MPLPMGEVARRSRDGEGVNTSRDGRPVPYRCYPTFLQDHRRWVPHPGPMWASARATPPVGASPRSTSPHRRVQASPFGSISPDSGGKCPQSGQKGGRFAASERWHGEAVTERALIPRGTGDPSPTDAIRRCCETVGDGFPIPGTVAPGGSKPPTPRHPSFSHKKIPPATTVAGGSQGLIHITDEWTR